MDCLSLVSSEIEEDGRGRDENGIRLLPKISIITPSYNQGRFIQETIESVINQGYPNAEHIIIDGGSTDSSVEIITKHQDKISYWISESDGGAADAIEKGRRRCSGELFNWLNSDDYLLPGTLSALGAIAKKYPEFDIYAFIGMRIWGKGPLMSWFGFWPDMTLGLISCCCQFAQESTFVRTKFLKEKNIIVRKEFCNAFDVVFYEEMLAKGARVLFINAFGGAIRHHGGSKTAKGTPVADVELKKELRKQLFNRRQRIWLRLSQTRLHNFLKVLCKSKILKQILIRLFCLSKNEFVTCTFSGVFGNDSNSWEIKT